MAARWLEKWLAETSPGIGEAAIAAAALSALGGPAHEAALAALRSIVDGRRTPTKRPRG